jgi:hypothetical protein
VASADRQNLDRIETLPTVSDEIFLAYRGDAMKSAAARAVIEAAKVCVSP